MVVRLATSGHQVVAWNRTPARAELLGAVGVRVAASAADAVESALCTILMLADFGAIVSVLESVPDESLAGRTIIQMGTIAPRESQDLLARVQDAGAEYLEAPVLGSIPQAQSGSLRVLVGTDPVRFKQWRPLLSHFDPEPLLVGPVGTAATLKLALNQLIAALTAAFSFSLGMTQRGGIDTRLFMEVLRKSALYAPTFDKKLTRMLKRDFGTPNFSAKHMAKDLKLIEDAGRDLGLSTDTVAALRTVLQQTLALGHAESDYSSLYEALDPPQTNRS